MTQTSVVPGALQFGPRQESFTGTVAEFFAGIGLMRMGLERRGWKVAWANDIDPAKLRMYSAHFGDGGDVHVLGDVHQLDPATVPSVTLASASFPCTDLSVAGARAGLNAGGSAAFWGFVSALRGMGERRPPLVLLENVPGLITSHGGSDLRQALLALNELGYAVDMIQVDAAWFVPQSRQRVFIAGALSSASVAREPLQLALFGDCDARPASVTGFIRATPDIRWDLVEVPPPPARSVTLPDVLDVLPEDAPQWWSPTRAEYLLSQMSPRHLQTAHTMIASDSIAYGTIFRRVRRGVCMAELRTDGLAGCLRTPKGGSGRQVLFEAGQGRYRVRLLTPDECARLMGADGFTIDCGDNKALFGFGDAVCVPAVEWVSRHFVEPRLASFGEHATYSPSPVLVHAIGSRKTAR